MSYPIFFINTDMGGGENYWLKYVLKQAKFFNPESEVILIANKNIDKAENISYYCLKDYASMANKFKKIYIHLSSNDYNYEFFCIMRWFILNEFIIKNNINTPFFYFDSDVLLLSSVKNIMKDFSLISYDYTCTQSGGPQYFRNKNIINNFCNLINSYYLDSSKISGLKNFYSNIKKLGKKGGVNDMYFLGEFRKISTNYRDLYIENKAKIFDSNIHSVSNYKYIYYYSHGNIHKIKKVTINKKGIYFYNVKTKRYIKSYGLHFQGVSKIYIPYFYIRTCGIKNFLFLTM